MLNTNIENTKTKNKAFFLLLKKFESILAALNNYY